MNELLQGLMAEATLLTRNGRLQEATQAIQRALQGGARLRPGDTGPSATRPPTAPVRWANDAWTIDGQARVIDISPAQPDDMEATIDAPVEAEAPVQDRPQSGNTHEERWTDGHFAHQGRSLAYKLYLPPAAASTTPSPRPLLVMLHGCTQGAADFAAGTQMNALARDLGVIVLYPEQTQHANSQKCWNWFKTQHQQRGRGEPALLAALTQSVMAMHPVDASRVFVAGLSAGGAMADILGRCYPDLFAAIGVHSGLPSGCATNLPSALAAMRGGGAAPIAGAAGRNVPATIVFHGDADTTVHVSNGAAIVEAARGEDPGQPPARVAEGRSGRGQRYTRTVHTDATGRTTVEYWQLHGAGHAWSGGSPQGTYTDPSGVDASAEMLRFFLAHPRRA